MKNSIRRIVFQLLLLMCFRSFAQSNFNVDYDEIKGKLSQTDKYKNDFGRYHGYELPLYEGETANFAVYSNDFNARIVLVNPQGKVFKQSGQPSNGFTSIITQIPISGDWILYVVGDQKDTGNFLMRYAFANANSISVPSNMDFCSTMNYLIAHANAHFMMLQVTPTNNSLPKIPNSSESFIDSESGAFVNIIVTGDESSVEKQFKEYSMQLKSCLPEWKILKDVKKDNPYIQFQDKDKTKIELESVPTSNEKDRYDLLIKISK